MKRMIVIAILFLAFAAGQTIAATPSCKGKQYTEKAHDTVIRGEALIVVRVPAEISSSKDRNKLFADLCTKVARAASADIVYVSPIYDTSHEGTAHLKSVLETGELIRRLKEDKNIIGASPNFYHSLSTISK